ncbi:MAG: hypothetical protein ABEH65_08945 [Halobacteriales archaeon]
MTENRSLTDFLGDGDGDDDEQADRGESATERTKAVCDVTGGEGDDMPVDTITDESGPTSEDGTEATETGTAVPIDHATVSPASATYTWDPSGSPCARCGQTAEARWRDGEELVCGDCKEW